MRNSINTSPKAVSHRQMDRQLVSIPGTTVAKEEPRNLSPRTILICEKITVVAAAEQKPEITGPDMKSMRKPYDG